jgi:hypothetical protein
MFSGALSFPRIAADSDNSSAFSLASNASLFIFTVSEASEVNPWEGFAQRDGPMLRYRHSP